MAARRTRVPHTRAVQRDRILHHPHAPPDDVLEAHLTQLLQPATFAQLASFRQEGLRERVLSLPVMVAFLVSLLWRQIGSVREAVRVLAREGFLWVAPTRVSHQALCQRLRTLPPSLFAQIFTDLLPTLQQRARERRRPLPAAVAAARAHFESIVALDGSTLDTLLRKVGLLREGTGPVLAGRIAALLDVASLLPRQLWYEPDSDAHDQCFWERVLEKLTANTLVLFDLGFVNHAFYDQLVERGIHFVTRAKSNAAYQVEKGLTHTDRLRDQIVRLGSRQKRCRHLLRLVEVQVGGKWHRFVTSVTDEQVLSAVTVAGLYGHRWRIEEAFRTVKRLLGLAYFFGGSQNAVQVQVWGTWLLYAVLVDLTDAVAEEMRRPLSALSLEMVYRGLYHYSQARQRGETQSPVAYLAAEAPALAILKQRRTCARRAPPT